MTRTISSGLVKRGNLWHIRKQIYGCRLRESTGTALLSEAENYLARRIEDIRQARVYGVRPKRSFKDAATKYLLENQHKASIRDDADHLKNVCQYIGHLTLEQVHTGTLQTFIKARQALGRKTKTINNALEVVRHLLNLASSQWLPAHLKSMALFKVNTGCREQEVCQLKWQWEINIPELSTSIFIIPNHLVKNGEDRLVVLNDMAKSVIEKRRGMHSEYVFSYANKPVTKMNNTAWKRARMLAGLSQVRVHDLKHTFGRRLRSVGVSYEDRQDLLGHKSERITTHYSAVELDNLITAANKVCDCEQKGTLLTLLKTNRTFGDKLSRLNVTKVAQLQQGSNG